MVRAAALGATMRTRMVEWQGRFEEIGDVRGLGAMLAIELVHDRDSKDPAPELVSAVCAEAFRNGLLLLSAGITFAAALVAIVFVRTRPEVERAHIAEMAA